jgi:hypothetical protein
MSILAGIFATAYWFYAHIIAPDVEVATELTAMKEKGAPQADPGIKRFEKAIELIQGNDLNEGRAALYDLVRTFPESSRVEESKRIIGEINMDMLFDSELNPLKKDYIVQPGDSLNLIARKQQTTVECVLRANGMQSGTLQPGDHLFVFPLDFTLVIHVGGKSVTLLRNDRFFREFPALDVKLTPPKAPYEARVSDKPAWARGKRASPLSPEFMTADKWISIEKKTGDKTTFNIRALPKAKPADAAGVITPSASNSPKQKSKSGGKKVEKKGEALPGTAVDDDEVDVTAAAPASGIFLSTEDVEELFTILRTNTQVKVLR